MAKTPPPNFNSLAGSLLDTSTPTNGADVPKDKLTSLHIDGDLIQPLERVVYHSGRKSSQRKIVNEALRFFFAHNESARAKVTMPTPDERA